MGVAWVGEVYTVGVIASGRSVGGGSAAVLGEKGESWRVEVERGMNLLLEALLAQGRRDVGEEWLGRGSTSGRAQSTSRGSTDDRL